MERFKLILTNQATQGLLAAVVIFFVANWLGHIGLGLSLMLAAVMVVYSVILVAFRRFSTVEVLAQPNRDERTFTIHLKSSAASLSVVTFVVVGAFLVDLAHGHTGITPWVTMGAVIGVSYLLPAIFFSVRG